MIKHIWKEVKQIYQNKQATLYTSTVVVTLTLLLARVIGVIKLRVLTNYYDKAQLDLFFAAFRVPDFIFEVLIAGSVTACFIPIINDLINKKQDKPKVMEITQTLSFIFLIIWAVLFLLILPFSEQVFGFMLPGFTHAQIVEVSHMSVIILIMQVPFLVVGNLFSAVLQAEKQFFIPGLAPVFYNVGIIVGVVAWAGKYGLSAALYGVNLGAVLYVLVLVPGIYLFGYRPRFKINFLNERLKTFFRLFVSRMFSSLVAQIDASVDLALATLRGLGGYTTFYLAKNLQLLPVSFLGIAIAQTALPFFTDYYDEGEKGKLMDVFMKLILQIFFITTPIVIFFTILRVPVVRLFFGGQKFDWLATVQTANSLSLFALSLPFHTAYYVVTRVFFALRDTRTPFIAGLIFTILNTVLSVVFMYVWNLPVWYLAVSFSISISLNTCVLFYILIKRLDHVKIGTALLKLTFIFFIGLVTGITVLLLKKLLDGLVFDTSRTINLFFLTGICLAVEGLTYLYLSWILLPSELNSFIGLFTRINIIRQTVSHYKRIFYPEKMNGAVEEKY